MMDLEEGRIEASMREKAIRSSGFVKRQPFARQDDAWEDSEEDDRAMLARLMKMTEALRTGQPIAMESQGKGALLASSQTARKDNERPSPNAPVKVVETPEERR
jgi:hypothetical protein